MPKPRIEYVEDQVMIKRDIIGRGQTTHGKILPLVICNSSSKRSDINMSYVQNLFEYGH